MTNETIIIIHLLILSLWVIIATLALSNILNKILINTKKIMATLEELSIKVDELQITVDAEQAQILAAVEVLNQAIIDLQAQIDAGGDSVAIQAIMDKLDATKSDLESTVPPPAG